MQFVMIAKDGIDAEALDRRMAVREAHLANMKKLKAEGHYIIGGAILDDDGTMIGSTIILDFPDRAALDLWLVNDPYTKGDVWQHIDVYPFRSAGVSNPSTN